MQGANSNDSVRNVLTFNHLFILHFPTLFEIMIYFYWINKNRLMTLIFIISAAVVTQSVNKLSVDVNVEVNVEVKEFMSL